MFDVRMFHRLVSRSALSFLLLFFITLFMSSHVDAKSIRIGVIGPMQYLQGKHHWLGAQMAAEEINKDGGVKVGENYYTIELIRADSNEMVSVPDAVSTFRRVIRDVDFMVGSFRSEAVLAMMEVMADHRKIFITCGAVSPELSKRLMDNYDRYKYWFRGGSVNSINSAPALYLPLATVANSIRDELGIERPKIAILAEKALWVDPIVDLISGLAPRYGLEVVGSWRPAIAASSVMPELTAIRRAGAHMIMTYSSGPAGLTYSRQWGELEIPAAMIGVNVEAQKITHWEATGGLCNYDTMLSFMAPVDATPRSRSFYNNFLDKTGEIPSLYAATYDAIYVLKEAAERAGTIESDQMVESLKKTDFGGAQGRLVYYGKDEEWPHDLRYGPEYISLFYVQWRDGEQKVVWPDGSPEVNHVRYEGTVDYSLPPQMINYWKKQQAR